MNYYGPLSVNELTAIIDKTHQTAKKLQAVPQNNYYVKQEAKQNEVWIAPFDAKNIYMRAYHNENRDWNIEEAAVQAVFARLVAWPIMLLLIIAVPAERVRRRASSRISLPRTIR